MKKLLRSLLALLLALPAAAQAQATRDADPALWVVKDADTTIYLFGTVHVLKPGLSWFDEAVKAAFDKSDEVKLEIVTPDPAAMQALMLKTGVDATGQALTQKLPEAKRAGFTKAITELGLSPADVDRLRPWLVAMQLSIAPLVKLGYDPASGAEQVIAAAAKAAGKPVTGLETPEEQIGFLASLPEATQIQYLVSVVDDLDKVGAELDTMVKSWADGDPDALARTMNEELKATPDLAKALLTDRNARWADWIAQRMARPGTVFIAVGAGHLAGADSVQSFLAKRHLKAKRIAY